jgi:hypothetical protein
MSHQGKKSTPSPLKRKTKGDPDHSNYARCYSSFPSYKFRLKPNTHASYLDKNIIKTCAIPLIITHGQCPFA